MEIKELIWRDNVTKNGKEIGLFEILSNVKELGITYHIRNYKYHGGNISDKFYLIVSVNNDEVVTTGSSVDFCKDIAQEHFKQKVLKLFFK